MLKRIDHYRIRSQKYDRQKILENDFFKVMLRDIDTKHFRKRFFKDYVDSL